MLGVCRAFLMGVAIDALERFRVRRNRMTVAAETPPPRAVHASRSYGEERCVVECRWLSCGCRMARGAGDRIRRRRMDRICRPIVIRFMA